MRLSDIWLMWAIAGAWSFVRMCFNLQGKSEKIGFFLWMTTWALLITISKWRK